LAQTISNNTQKLKQQVCENTFVSRLKPILVPSFSDKMLAMTLAHAVTALLLLTSVRSSAGARQVRFSPRCNAYAYGRL
jgi:hypothetical protein